jgi:hypothetical protein
VRRALAILILAAFAVPASAFAQSAGDEQYVDPFQDEGSGGQAQQEPEPQPAPEPTQPEEPAEPLPAAEGQAEEPAAGAAQTTSPALPRTGAPVILFAAAGYALLLAGIAIRRQT